jgi:membrane protein
MTGTGWRNIGLDAVRGFIADECLSRAASIAYFTLFSLSPLLVIAMAIAGAAFGEDAVRGAVQDQLRGLLGREAAAAIEAAISGARDVSRGTLAGLLGVGMLVLTASGTFGEIQSALNAIWKTKVPPQGTVSRLLRAKAAAIGLVAGTGFLLLASLLASAAIAAFGTTLKGLLPGSAALLEALNAVVSLALTAALFGAIYKILPDRRIAWRDVAVGALATAILFTLGKSAIGLYVGGAGIAGSFGAAGSLAAVLVWIYYSAVIFLLGAEFTRAWARHEGSRRAAPVPPAVAPPSPPVAAMPARSAFAAKPTRSIPAATPAQPPAPLGAIAATLAAVVGVILLRRPRQRG